MTTEGDLVGPIPEGVEPSEYDRLRRRVLWSLPMGLYLLGSRDAERLNLMTLNWLMQVSTRPKQVAISVEKSAVTHGLVRSGGAFAVSVLSREDRAVARKFVKPAVHDPEARTLNGFAYHVATTGAPIAEVAAAYLDCEVRQCVDVGSHTLFVGEVVDAGGHEVPVLRMEDTRMSYGG